MSCMYILGILLLGTTLITAEETTSKGPSQCGLDYSGTVSVTASGITCQRWDQQTPHSHPMTAQHMPESTLTEAQNYCRTPDRYTGGPWCYTTDPSITWEVCNIPMCGTEGAPDAATDATSVSSDTMAGTASTMANANATMTTASAACSGTGCVANPTSTSSSIRFSGWALFASLCLLSLRK